MSEQVRRRPEDAPTAPAGPVYVLGHAPAELDRLRAQGVFFEDITRRAIEAAGVRPGSRVLDIGCGAGDVSLLVAEIVGPDGSVIGIDRAPEAVAVARARPRRPHAGRVEFHVGEIGDLDEGVLFDALVGRFVLMHQGDPASTLRAAARRVRPGGQILMIESAMSACVAGAHSFPHSPAYDWLTRVMTDTICAAGADSAMGLRLNDVFEAAGLSRPTMWLQARVEGGPDAAIYHYMAESLRSMLPFAAEVGVRDHARVHIDRLEDDLRAEVVASRGTLVSPPIIAAWTTS